MVTNIHFRDFHVSITEVSAILDSLASPEEKLWPIERWPAMTLEQPVRIGSQGGHSLIKYEVDRFEPGRLIRFRFLEPSGFIGTHEFSVKQVGQGKTRLQHSVNLTLSGKARLQWVIAVRWLHDALVEDALDKVESHLTGKPWEYRKLSFWTQFLKNMIRRQQLVKFAKNENKIWPD